jgi:hypothetical protein
MDGGTYYYTLTLLVPVPLFARLGDEVSDLEQKISKRFENVLRAPDKHRVTAVVIQPGIVKTSAGTKEHSPFPDFGRPPGTGESHLAQAIGRAVIQQGYCVLYREAHTLLEELADATLDGTRKAYLADLAAVPLLIIDDLGMRKLPHTAAEDLLEIIMRRYERVSTLLTSNRPVDDWGKLLGDTAAVTALLDRLLHHAHVLKC